MSPLGSTDAAKKTRVSPGSARTGPPTSGAVGMREDRHPCAKSIPSRMASRGPIASPAREVRAGQALWFRPVRSFTVVLFRLILRPRHASCQPRTRRDAPPEADEAYTPHRLGTGNRRNMLHTHGLPPQPSFSIPTGGITPGVYPEMHPKMRLSDHLTGSSGASLQWTCPAYPDAYPPTSVPAYRLGGFPRHPPAHCPAHSRVPVGVRHR